jgi:glycine dehydrogenase subunit 1
MSLMGPAGLRRVAETSLYRAHYLRDRIESITGFTVPLSGPFFNEFVVHSSVCADDMNEELLAAGIIGGKSIESEYPELSRCTLWAVTEKRTREQLDTLIGELEVLV